MSYAKNWAFGGYHIHGGKNGWIVTYWSRVQGVRDGRKVVVNYDACGIDAEWFLKLYSPHNDQTTKGEYIAMLGKEHPDRVLRKGDVVQ